MAKAWDWVVGLSLLAVGLPLQAIIAALVATPVILGLVAIGVKEQWVAIATWILMLVLLNVAGFVDYYHFRQINRAGVFHFVPRALERIRRGHELPNAIEESTGEPVDIQGPIAAGVRLVCSILISIASAAAFVFAITGKGDALTVLAAVSLVAFPIGLLLTAQASLAYVGVLKRK